MKAYGVRRRDASKDCTEKSKFGTAKLASRCACGIHKINVKLKRKIKSAGRARQVGKYIISKIKTE